MGSAWHALGARITPQSTPHARSSGGSTTILALWFIARLWPLVPDVGLPPAQERRPAPVPAAHRAHGPRDVLRRLAGDRAGRLPPGPQAARRGRVPDRNSNGARRSTITAGNTLVTAELAAIALLLPVLVMLSRLADGTRSMLIAALLGTWLAWTALQPSLGHAGVLSVNVPAMTDFFAVTRRNPRTSPRRGSATSRSPGCWPEQG